MKYISYLQNGGNIVQALIEKVVQSQGQDQSALQQLVQLAEEGNEEAVAFLQELQGQSPAMKCGGRVKKKQLGEKIVKAKKASCGCQLKKVGGRLIEVDGCTGLPVHRTGAAIKKYQNTPGSLTYMSSADATADAITNALTSTQKQTTPLGNVYVGYGSNTISTNPNHSYVGEKGNFGNLGDYQYHIDRDGRNTLYAMGKDGKYYMGKKGFWSNLTGIGGDNFNNWTELTGDQITDEIKGYFNPQTAVADGKSGRLSTDAGAVAGKAQYNSYGQALQPDGTYAGVTYGQRNAAAAGMLGADGKTGMTVAERQAWMNGAGKDYLASLNGGQGLGFSAADYTGTAAQNRALFNAYKGFGAWQSAQPQVQPEVQPEVQPTVYTNQQLLGMTDEQAAAAGLSADDIARRTKLNNYQTARNTALTFNGQQYADEAAYNSAVDAYNQNLTNKYTTDRTAAYDKYMANRALATTAGTQGITARRQAAFDNLAKLNNGTLKYSDLSRRDIRDMQRQYRRGKDAGYYTAATAKDFYANQNGVAKPELAQKFNGNAVLTDEQLNATSFKQGGQLNYANYLN